jgi:hypothetical protein
MAKQGRRGRRTTVEKKSPPYHARTSLSNPNALQEVILFAFLALAVSILLHFSTDKFADPDAFYHFRHAALYAEGNGLSGQFPWIPYSVISKFSSDIWFGFHILLIPFAWIGDPVLGLQLAGVVITALCLFSVYLACVRLDIKAAYFWPFVFLFSSAFLLHRLTMLRPHVLSLGLAVLLLAQLAAGKMRSAFIVAMAITWLHLSLFFVPLIFLGVLVAVKFLSEKNLPWRESLAVTGGLVMGWLLRPNPLGAAKIAYVQVFHFGIEKVAGAPLLFGSELQPMNFAIYSNYLPFTILWSLALLYLFCKLFSRDAQLAAGQRTIGLAVGVLSLFFFILSVLFARRAFDFCSAFGTIVIALAVSHFVPRSKSLRIVLLGLFIAIAVYGISLRHRVLSLALGFEVDRLASAAKWLEANANPGDIVFNLAWEHFPELFFWNTKNFYTSGMDPIFQYAFDRQLFDVAVSFTAAKRSVLCVTGVCPDAPDADPYRILKDKFKARYVFLVKEHHGDVYLKLLRDKRFELKIDANGAAVFEVL